MGELVIVVDNFPGDPELKRDWGFSAYLRSKSTLLFDLGNREDVFVYNVEKLNIDLSKVDCVVISHSDFDHVGGLDYFLSRNRRARFVVPKGFDERMVDRMVSSGHDVVVSDGLSLVCDNFLVTGPIEPSPKPEQSLFFRTSRGYWIVSGCSHPGVVNVIDFVRKNVEGDIDLYLGGFHLFRTFDEELEEVVRKVRETGIRRVAPCHCSGHEARELFEEEFGENFVRVGVGSKLTFET